MNSFTDFVPFGKSDIERIRNGRFEKYECGKFNREYISVEDVLKFPFESETSIRIAFKLFG